jgi:magnesium transporter
MAIETILQKGTHLWLDITAPTADELDKVARDYSIPPHAIADCLDSRHLPKFENLENISFLILRAYDLDSAHDADTVQELTRKIAIFYTDTILITVHRKEQPYIQALKHKWKANSAADSPRLIGHILHDITRAVLLSYAPAIDEAFTNLERLEIDVFGAQGARPFEIKEGYYLKRKASVFKRMLRASTDQLSKINDSLSKKGLSHHQQQLREIAESSNFDADELVENTNSLLNLHLSLASYRTNEVVRILTIFSVFLLPLNLVTGIYGMNFENMPELKWYHGYPFALSLMITIVSVTFLYFKRKGWLK